MRTWGWLVVAPFLLGSTSPDPTIKGVHARTNVLDHGVVADGVSDNAAALDAAAIFAASHGLILYFPPGVYGYLGEDFDMRSNLHIRGAGAELSIIKSLDASVSHRMVNFYGDDDVIIEDMGFDGNFTHREVGVAGSRWEAKILNISGSDRVRIRRCIFRDMTHGIVIGASRGDRSRDIEISDCDFYMQTKLFQRSTDGQLISAFGVLAANEGSENVTVARCYFTGGADNPEGRVSGSSAISLGGDQLTVLHNEITDFHHGNGGIAIHLSETSSRGTVESNTSIRCGGDNLSIRGADHEVTGNTIIESDDQGIACENATRCTFVANHVDSTRTAAIRILNATNCTFKDNSTKDPGSRIGGPPVTSAHHSHYLIQNKTGDASQIVDSIVIEDAMMVTTNDDTDYAVFMREIGVDRVANVLLGRNNVFVTSQGSDTLWGGGVFPDSLQVGSTATGRLRDAPGGRYTVASDPDTAYVWDGESWRPIGAGSGATASRRSGLRLDPGYPNPFRPYTTLDYSLPETASVTVMIHDVLGRRVRMLVDGVQRRGLHTVTWDGRNEDRRRVPAGTYFVKLHAGEEIRSRKIVLIP